MTDQIPLSVIMPAYNEEAEIERAVREVCAQVLDHVPGAELVVVNDGSRDGTGARLDALAHDPRIRVRHQANAGHGAALRTGIDTARGECFFLLDSDRQIALDGFAEHWALLEDRDAVFGVRRERDDPRVRRALTVLIRWYLRVAFGVTLTDANVPYKLFRRTVWARASHCIPRDTLAPSLFLAVHAMHSGARVTCVDVPHRQRMSGEVSLRHGRLLRFAWRAFGQLRRFQRALPDA